MRLFRTPPPRSVEASSEEHKGLLYSMASTLWAHLGLDQLTGTPAAASSDEDGELEDGGDAAGSVPPLSPALAAAGGSRAMTPSTSSSSLASSFSSLTSSSAGAGASAADLASLDRPCSSSAGPVKRARSPRSSSGASSSSAAAGGPTVATPLSPDQPLMACYRPLLFYVLMEAVAAWCHFSLTVRMGFTKAGMTDKATYYVKEGEKAHLSSFFLSRSFPVPTSVHNHHLFAPTHLCSTWLPFAPQAPSATSRRSCSCTASALAWRPTSPSSRAWPRAPAAPSSPCSTSTCPCASSPTCPRPRR